MRRKSHRPGQTSMSSFRFAHTLEIAQYLGARQACPAFHSPLIPIKTVQITSLLQPHGHSGDNLEGGAGDHLLQVAPFGDGRVRLIPLLTKQAPKYLPLRVTIFRSMTDKLHAACHLGIKRLTAVLP